jgi:hypothetical protein
MNQRVAHTTHLTSWVKALHGRWSAAYFLHGCTLVISLAACTAMAQPKGAKPTCLVAEFRSVALQTHDPRERASKATEWLNRYGPSCSETQMKMIASNRGAWLGHADTVMVSGAIDGLIEGKIAGNADQMAQAYNSKGKEGRASVETFQPPPAPQPVVKGQAPGLAATALVVPVLQPPGADGQRRPRADAKFDDKQRSSVKDFFADNRGSGPCPPGLILKNKVCESLLAERAWKFDQPLPASVASKEIPPGLREKLGRTPPGQQFVQVAGDILLVAGDAKVVVDAIMDLGKPEPKIEVAQAKPAAGAAAQPAR